MSKGSIKGMVDALTQGDLAKASGDFNDAMTAKIQASLDDAKVRLASTAFADMSAEVTHEPIDTGITGNPEETEEEK
jgi:ATP phosphoribosyltransferase|tara:strand:- start:280 stop:510 length:231 start_codon:yes stop_codon:yes gene_type:complete